ncbi:MAG: hypothetical protein AAGB12_04480 [Pseudomonadota bacterium]
MNHIIKIGWLLIVVLQGCTIGPQNGNTQSGNTATKSISMTGYYTDASTPISIEAFNMSSGSWVVIGNTTSSATPALDNDSGTLYSWSVSVVPGTALWVNNGLVQLRARATVSGSVYNLVSFDDNLDCLIVELNAGKNYTEAGAACVSYNNPNIMLVDTDGLPNINTVNYLNIRSEPQNNLYDYDCSDPGQNCEQSDYYQSINAPSTFNAWLIQNGFSSANPGGTIVIPPQRAASAKYYNAFDLGLGRDMNCRQEFSGRVACYVTNYGTPVIDDHDSALNAVINQDSPVATVAMTYFPNVNSNAVTFYVYDGNGNLLRDIPLDQQGAKAVPGVCLNCHGGRYDPASNSVIDARFLPFDIENYEFSNNAAYTLNAQQESFRKLNQIVLATNVSADFSTLVNNWYDNNINTVGQTFDTEFVPSGWSENPVVYDQVIKPYCRVCHIALESYRDWDNLAEFANYGAYAIDLARNSNTIRMPQAQLTLQKFWKSGARAHLVSFMQKHASVTPSETCTP